MTANSSTLPPEGYGVRCLGELAETARTPRSGFENRALTPAAGGSLLVLARWLAHLHVPSAYPAALEIPRAISGFSK